MEEEVEEEVEKEVEEEVEKVEYVEEVELVEMKVNEEEHCGKDQSGPSTGWESLDQGWQG